MAQPSIARKENTDVAGLIIAVACGLAIMITALYLAVIPFIRSLSVSRDFVFYWAAGQQVLHHLNPWDARMMGQVEHAAGFTAQGSYYMRNPPWSLPLALPLGLLPARVAALPWSLLMLALAVFSARTLWAMLGRPGNYVQWLGYAFPPALQCVVMGQTSLFPLFGLVLFLRLHRSRPFWAGTALWFCTLKPHLFLPWAVALFLWIAVSRAWRILIGGVAAMAASCLITEALDPHAWSQYFAWARTSGISHQYVPCLSVELRNLLRPGAEWLAFVPVVIASLWAFAYFWPRRHAWDWMTNGNLLLLVSLVAAPYCWFYDQCLAMPALLAAVACTRSRVVLGGLGVLYLATQFQPYVFNLHLSSPMYLWTGPAWLAWYLWARVTARHRTPEPATAPA
jgi:hypothetical protein